MRALSLGPDGPFLDRSHTLDPRPGEVRLGLRVGGVCATDLELVKGYMGFHGVLGHEFVAEVLEAPDPDLVGARVVGEINAACGRCPVCRAGRPTHCPSRTVLGIAGRDGAFAEQFWLPAENLHVVPDGVPDEAAVFVEPLAAACRILEQVHVRPTDRVVVLGLGRLGQLCARVLALAGANVAGVSRSSGKLDLLPAGIQGVLASDADALSGADVVVDCTGSPEGLATATSLVRPGGTLVMKTTVHDLGPASPTAWVVEEITLVGSRCGPFAPALRMLASGLVDPTPLITGVLPLEQGLTALEQARAPGGLKVLLDARH